MRCTLEHVFLEQCPVYDALSYTWGDVFQIGEILVDGQPFRATSNLVAALEHFRSTEHDVRLWIDAICLYVDRYQTKYRGNLRLGPLFLRGFVLRI